MRWGVPSYRLPPGVLREEIARIEEAGGRIHCENTFGKEFPGGAASPYDAVFVACGVFEAGPQARISTARALILPGEDLPGIEDGIELLRKVAAGDAPALEGPVAVIGGRLCLDRGGPLRGSPWRKGLSCLHWRA